MQETFRCFQNCFVGYGCPSVLYFQVDHCVPICPLCMGHLQKPLHESSSPEAADCIKFAHWICCALCSTQSAHSQPSRKQSQPRQSWYHASTSNLEFGFSSKVSVCVPPASRSCLNKCTTFADHTATEPAIPPSP